MATVRVLDLFAIVEQIEEQGPKSRSAQSLRNRPIAWTAPAAATSVSEQDQPARVCWYFEVPGQHDFIDRELEGHGMDMDIGDEQDRRITVGLIDVE
jgi:hypothetical protein